MKFVGLRVKFGVLFVAVVLLLTALNVVWNWNIQNEQAKERMLETAQVLARQCEAVWDFMEINQDKFAKKPDGTYDMYCVVAAKSVTRLFSGDGGYVIHYTNSTTRKPYDAPDEFERGVIDVMKQDGRPRAYYTLAKNEAGEVVFRYLEPIYITESCLECHGSPKGELDMMGFPKEGLQVGDVSGVISITVPAAGYLGDVLANTIRQSGMFFLAMAAGLIVIFYSLSRLVTRPLKRLGKAAAQVERRDFDLALQDVGDRDEIRELAAHFESMAAQLDDLYSNLEEQVLERTEQVVRANRSLEQMNERLQREGRYKDDFLATMSHEIRTPLTSILAFTDIYAAQEVERSTEEQQALESLRYNTRLLLEMVNNVLSMARAEAGRIELQPAPFDVSEFVSYMREGMRFFAHRHDAELRFKTQRGIPVLMADGEKLKHILENLITNAVKFSGRGGVVEVSVSYDDASETLRFDVADNGCGIEASDLPTIFDRFVRSSSSGPQRGTSGSGLGLAVVREFATEHGGKVWVESQVGEGSVFHVEVHAPSVTVE